MKQQVNLNGRIKVALICHFSSEFVQNKLPLLKQVSPFAAWISNILEGFKNSDEFEIHVIAPHSYLKKEFKFIDSGIFYYFYPVGIPFIRRPWPRVFRFDVVTSFFFNRLRIKRIIESIKPDLINIHGSENPQYCSSFLDLYKKYPILVSIQGFIHLDTFSKNDYIKRNRISIEKQILQKCKYFCLDKDSESIIKQFRTAPFNSFGFYYPISRTLENYPLQKAKEFDLLYWGRICKDKGVEDFISVISKLKAHYPDIKACIIGGGLVEYIEYIKNKIKELSCSENITYKGFINSNEDLYREATKCKVLLIPTYNDRFPTVLREATFLRLAVISYNTGSIPQFNKTGENILIVEQGNIEQLFLTTKKLLTDSLFYETLVEKAYQRGIEEFGIKQNCNKIAAAYKQILKKENKF